jgi:UDP-N-acetylglucosamine 1-carboxyvinyltransferase
LIFTLIYYPAYDEMDDGFVQIPCPYRECGGEYMSSFLIEGKNKLCGSVRVHGAKNSVLPILAATIISGGVSEIHDCPRLSDVESTIKILRYLGCEVSHDENCITVDSSAMTACEIPDSLMREMRSSVIFLGAIIARTGSAVISYPGGCELGPRPIDLHLFALRELGVIIDESSGKISCKADKLKGKDIHLNFPSVGATENIMLAAVGAEGRTRIFNAAREPEIEDLQAFLAAAGAKIHGAGSSTIEIEGGYKLSGVRHRIIPDRIVASTYMAAVACAGGAVTIENVKPEHISSVSSVLRAAGCEICEKTDKVHIVCRNRISAIKPIRTMPYPGFPTDSQSIIMSALAAAQGTTVFVENIFESRYRHAGELLRMGADIRIEGRVAIVCGVDTLHGAEVVSADLRGGAALVIAAMGAEGSSVVHSMGHIERGYEDILTSFQSIGANIILNTDKKP